MLQIGEFSKACQTSVKTLHHYDKIGLLIPAEVDHMTGYRYYRTEQINQMNYIQRLKRYGFSLEEIQYLITVSDHKELMNILRRQCEKICAKQQEMQIILKELQTHISVFERTGDVMAYQKGYTIEVKDSPQMYVLAQRAVMGVDEFAVYYGKLFERIHKESPHITPSGLNGARYYDVMEPCSCAMTVHHGPYSTLSEAYGAVISWIAENGYEIAGAPFDLYTKTQLHSLSPEDWETEVYFPIRKK